MIEELREVLSYLASEALKARKFGKNERVEELSIAFKILSKEYDKIRKQESSYEFELKGFNF